MIPEANVSVYRSLIFYSTFSVTQARHITSTIMVGAEYMLDPCHDSLLIGAYSHYANMIVEAKRKWSSLVQQHLAWTQFRNSLVDLQAGGDMEDEHCRLDPELL